MIKAVWPDVTVTDESLTRCISEVRRAIGDDAQEIIKTVSRRGYLFDSPDLAGGHVEARRRGRAAAFSAARQSSTRDPSTNRPSIAVLPFANMSGDPEQEYFSDGITEDIITDLSKISGLFVVARNTTFTYKGRAVNVRQVSEDLNVKFILEGSVRKAGSRVRVTAQLIEGQRRRPPLGRSLRPRSERHLRDPGRDHRTIVDQLKVKLLPEENRAIGGTPTESVEAYAYYLRGRQFLHRRSKTFLELAQTHVRQGGRDRPALCQRPTPG